MQYFEDRILDLGNFFYHQEWSQFTVVNQNPLGMYYIRKYSERWAVHNNYNGKSRALTQNEVQQILNEFPNLQNAAKSQSVTFFRNRISSIGNLP